MSNLKVDGIEDSSGGGVTFSDNVIIGEGKTFTSRGIDDDGTSIQLTITETDGEQVKVEHDLKVAEDLDVVGVTTMTGALTCGSTVTLSGFTGHTDASASAIQVDASSNALVTGDLRVNNAVDFDSTVNAGGLITAAAGITVNNVIGTFNAGITSSSVTATTQLATAEELTDLTIASGVITVTGSFHAVDTESDDPTDDLDTINGFVSGAILVLKPENDGRTIVLKNGTGNLILIGDCSLEHTSDRIVLIYDATLVKWTELARSLNNTDSGPQSWTPVVKFDATTITTTVNSAKYKIVGGILHFQCDISFDRGTTTGDFTVIGLPVAAAADTNFPLTIHSGDYFDVTPTTIWHVAGGTTIISGNVGAGTTGQTSSAVSDTQIAASTEITVEFSGFYFI
jgi:hypothetical protein